MAKFQEIINKQIRRWQMQREQREQVKRFVPPNVVTISNQLGSQGLQIADEVGRLLDCPVYDRQIVEHIATDAKVRVETVETLDEVAQNQLNDYVAALFRERNFDQSDYVRHLMRAVIGLWGHGTCVLIGRGGTHIVSKRYSLAARTVAERSRRIDQVEQTEGIERQDAIRQINRVDAERAGFIRRHFGCDIDDPLCYDLLLNTVGLSPQRAAQVIAGAFRAKFG